MTTAFVRASNPIWYFPDLEGLPLNDEYFIFFLSNVFPYVPQAVFQDVDGTIPWNNPLEFFPNGTLPDNLYFNDSQVYRLEIRHGNTQADPLIYEINDFVPGQGGGVTPAAAAGFTENQASNGQFNQISFTGTYTITTAGIYEVAPGWFLSLSGTGTTILTQQVLIADQDQINNPPYALRINNSGWSTADLYQRFENNGALWASNTQQLGFVSMSVTAQAQGSLYNPLSLVYRDSSGVEQVIASGMINTGSYQVLDGTIPLADSINPQSSSVAYIDMVIRLKPTGIIDITNVQVVGQELPIGSDTPATPVYKQETIERQIDHLFHYYHDSLIFQPKDTILTAWNFPLNPFQFVTTTVTTNVAQTVYICDQTILHQEAASQIATGIATNADRFGLYITPVDAATTTRFAIFQYPDTTTTFPYWSYKLSALVKLRFNSTHGTTIRFKMLLMYRTAGAPPAVSASEPIAGWSGTDLTLAAGWTAIKPVNDPIYSVSSSSASAFQNYVFNGFQLPTATTDTMYLSAVLYTVDNMNSSAGTKDYFVIDKISLVNNDFAIDTQPQTFDDVLRQCQFYYEKSYDNAVLPATSTLVGVINKYQVAAVDDGRCYGAPWEFQFNTVKRAIPTTTIVSAVGTINNVSFQIFRNGTPQALADKIIASFWTAGGLSTKSVEYLPNALGAIATAVGAGADNLSASIRFHYAASALLGT